MNMNKKGMFFTLTVLSIISLFLISYGFYTVISGRESINKRIESMNNFIFSLEKDMSRQIYISSYRAILGLGSYITMQGEFLNDSTEAIREVLINGTVDNQTINLMNEYRLDDWHSRVSDLGEKNNILINYTIEDVNVSQDDPWHVKIDVVINISIRDKNGLASWNRTQTISSKIEIINFEDPLYLISTNAKVINKINETVFRPFVDNVTVINLTYHISNMSYINSTQGPSFLYRLEGKTNASVYGIESLVNIPSLSAQGIAPLEKSAVDYIYFSSSDPPNKCRVEGMPDWFYLDDNHYDVYEVSNITRDCS